MRPHRILKRRGGSAGRCFLRGAAIIAVPNLIALGLLLISGCAQSGNTASSPSAVAKRRCTSWVGRFEDPSTRFKTKLRMDRRLCRACGVKSPVRLAALIFDIGCYGQDAVVKNYCMAQLWQADRPAAIAVLAARLPMTQRWRVLIADAALAARVKSPQCRALLSMSLMESLARPARRFAIPQRPEAIALTHMNHATLRSQLCNAFLASPNMESRLAAMRILYRWRGAQAIIAPLKTYTGADPLILRLQRYWRCFRFVPRTDTEVMWIEQWSRRLHRPQWNIGLREFCAIRRWQKRISPLQLIWLVHLAAGRAPSLPTPSALRQRIIARAAKHRHVKRPPWYAGAPDDVASAAAKSVPRLNYLSLVFLSHLQNLLSAAWFRSIIWRLGRTASRHRRAEPGGLLTFAPNVAGAGARLNLFPSAAASGPDVYVSSAALLRQTPAAMAEFIYHFQHVDNTRFCGPAIGDLVYARRNAAVVMIFTSISERHFDVAIDFPSGVVVDLGVYKAPEPA